MAAEEDRESITQAGAPVGAVFLSYASEDAAAAERIATALRGAGIQVWFDKSELRGGDAWDRQIRQQIHDCRLFIAVISDHTEVRDEGYFRREWRLAVDRTHDMAEDKAFVVPVVIDGTSERTARVPDSFKHVQWTHLPGGETPSTFVERVRRLLASDASRAQAAPTRVGSTTAPIFPTPLRRPSWSNVGLWTAGAVLSVALAYIAVDKLLITKNLPPTPPPAPPTWTPSPARATTTAAFNPPPHSIAVLPFVNMSGEKDQEYFSEGLTEELLNSLSRINELQVAARTSSFSFEGEHPDITTVAHKLNVASVLEGSVRRSGHTIRVTAQLNNAVTGFHLWSQTYDRNLGDVLKLQTDIANAVAGALKVTLLADVAAKIELGGTHNVAALDAYLRATKAKFDSSDDMKPAIALYTESLRRDPNYALAFSGRSIALGEAAEQEFAKPSYRDLMSRAEADARQAIALAPAMAEGHLALAYVFEEKLDLTDASQEYERALSLGPGNARVVRNYGVFAAHMGRIDAGLAATRHAVIIDPLNVASYYALASTTNLARRYEETLQVLRKADQLKPDQPSHAWEGFIHYELGEFQQARGSCELETSPNAGREICLAIVYDKLGRHVDATSMLAKAQREKGDSYAAGYAVVYAQWGETSKALDWLERAARLGDSALKGLRVDPLVDPLRQEPRFQAIERALHFPD